MQNLGTFRGVVKSVRQITTIDKEGKIASNLEVTFKEVTKKETDKEGKIHWNEANVPSIKLDGTFYECKILALSNRCLADIDFMSDPKLSTAAKKKLIQLFAKHANPMKMYSNVGELFTYLLKDRGIEFDRTQYDVGEYIIVDNGNKFPVTNYPVMQTNIDLICGNIIGIYDELITEWVGEKHETPTPQPQPQPQPQQVEPMWANV